VLRRDEIDLKFNDAATDSRTPDIIVSRIYGTILQPDRARRTLSTAESLRRDTMSG